jgi:hypothetical protein
MSTDYAEKEREFLTSLKEDTGRDLAEWMSLISAQGFSDKNQIIDWLRQQGFMFSKASWLERVHHNGGKPIYGDAHPRTEPRLAQSSKPQRPSPQEVKVVEAAKPAPDLPILATPSPEPSPSQPNGRLNSIEMDKLLVKAKAMRPLAQYLLGEIEKLLPDLALEPRDPLIVLSCGREFGALLLGPRELRLALNLENQPFNEVWKPARVAGPAPRFSPNLTHVTVLNDARQINAGLLEQVRIAAAPKG